jgi:uncharacterized protein (DUF4415 family)
MAKRSASSARGRRAAEKERPTFVRRKIDFSDLPEVSDEQLRTMRRVGRPPIGTHARQLIAIRLDPEVLNRFRTEARRRNVGYQTLIHRVLAEYVRAHVA